ncbi:MAG: type II toxin-antitoxin system RelE/ParE family toxin [Methylococcaceae bacterium]
MTAYTLKLHKQVKKFLQSLNSEWRVRFQEKLEILRQNPHGHPQLDIKPMQGAGEAVYRLRVGQYRLIYQIYEGEMIIFLMTAGSRGGVYK